MSTLAYAIPLSLFGGYIIVSTVLFRFPTLIHLKKKSKFNAKLIAHRGGAAENFENTITAFKHARSIGMEMLELDCQITKDKQIVVSHDDHLSRASGGDALIQDTNYEDLPTMCCPLAVTFTNGGMCTSESSDRHIPLLSEVFKEFKDFPINLDIKRNDEELINGVLDLIKEYKRETITVVGNFDSKIGDKVHKKAPEIPLLFGLTSIFKLFLLTYSGLLPFVPLKESYLEIPTGTLVKDLEWTQNSSTAMKTALRLYDFLFIRPFLFRHLQRRGIKIYLWVLNSEREWSRAISLGVDGIMTDYPSKLKDFCDAKGFSTSSDPLLENRH
ncbi:lysophospholipase D GDPD1 [Strongylocentrotus purpuratus]|uniref:GP-PDE domain-containing protein n=1 Tax=Strongylocentrotus purpuratus TaxID=7668 RepID=A0A7M7PD92_STRPU|nr:lysophospholipase D GDPD1 [Strongylocentrotus purpuratus]